MKFRTPAPLALAHGHTQQEPKGPNSRTSETWCPVCHGYYERIKEERCTTTETPSGE